MARPCRFPRPGGIPWVVGYPGVVLYTRFGQGSYAFVCHTAANAGEVGLTWIAWPPPSITRYRDWTRWNGSLASLYLEDHHVYGGALP